MRGFIERALAKVPRMNEQQIESLLYVIAEENERLEAVLDSMIEGIIVCDAAHVPLLYNKTAERLVPLSQSEPYERPIWDSVADDEIASFLRETLTGEERVLDREFAVGSKRGTRIVTVSVTPLVKDKRIQGTLVLARDITERMRREAQLRRAESLASLTTLAAGVAHEIKNPLGSLSIHVQLVKKALKAKSPDRETMDRYLSVVDEEIERLNRIVVDFLFAVRPMNMEPVEADANALVRELVGFMRHEIEASGITIIMSLAEKLPRVQMDARYMKQAVLNLVKNASAAMDEGGTLSVSTALHDDSVEIAVCDTGIGIPEGNIAKIFEPYFTTKENGTGLGLTLTYKIVKEHGGDMSVVSKEGKGSTFTIILPVPQGETRLLEYDGSARSPRAACLDIPDDSDGGKP